MTDDLMVRVLGPVEALAAAASPAAGTPQRRLLLAVLALSAGQVVPASELIDALWEEHPPPSVRVSLQSLVTRVRQGLAGIACVERRGDGYLLRLAPEQVDVHRFRALARTGRQAADADTAIGALDRALALWRGPALADVPGTSHVELIRSRLASEQLAAVQDRIGALLAAGRERVAAGGFPRC